MQEPDTWIGAWPSNRLGERALKATKPPEQTPTGGR